MWKPDMFYNGRIWFRNGVLVIPSLSTGTIYVKRGDSEFEILEQPEERVWSEKYRYLSEFGYLVRVRGETVITSDPYASFKIHNGQETVKDAVEHEQFTCQHSDAGTEPAAEPAPAQTAAAEPGTETVSVEPVPDNEQPAENTACAIKDEDDVVKIEEEEENFTDIKRGAGAGCCGCMTDVGVNVCCGIFNCNVQSSGGLCPWIRCC